MLPGEPDSAMQLDVLRRCAVKRVRCQRGGEMTGRFERDRIRVECPGGMKCNRASRLHVDEHVGARVLNSLEGGNGPRELTPARGVFDRHVQAALSRAYLLDGHRDLGDGQGLVKASRAIG